MRYVLCLALLAPVLALAAGTTQPITALAPEGGTIHSTPAVAPVDQGRVNIPPRALVGALDTIGGTTYDWWANGPILRMIHNSPGFGVHALWMYSASTSGTTFDDRNMRYNYYDYGLRAWNWLDPDYMVSGVNVFTDRAGYGNVDADPTSGAAIVGCHYNSGSDVIPKVAKDADAGTGIFDYADGAPVLGICQWAPIAVGQDGQISILPITAAYALSYSHIAAGEWPNFSTPITDFPSPGWCTHDITASKVSSKVAVTWSTNATTGGLEEAYADFSIDGGVNWGGATLVELPVAYGGDTVTSCHLSSLSPSYDAQDRFHIVANLMPMLNDTGFVLPSQIWHYCPDNSPAWSQIAAASVDPANYTTSVGYNATLACRPSIGEDDDGNLFVAWEQFDTANAEPITSRLRADIFAARSTDNGATWGEALKLTDAGTNSMRFPSVIDLAIEGDPDTFCIIYEIDQIAGFFVQSEGAATNNAVAVQKVSIDLLPMAPPAVAEQKGATPLRLDAVAKPNPSGGRTMISYALPQTSDVSLVVYDAVGRPVQTLASGRRAAGRYTATWNAGNAAAGVYFYTLTSGKTSVTRKLILTD